LVKRQVKAAEGRDAVGRLERRADPAVAMVPAVHPAGLEVDLPVSGLARVDPVVTQDLRAAAPAQKPAAEPLVAADLLALEGLRAAVAEL
jgi:hypothetical protein